MKKPITLDGNYKRFLFNNLNKVKDIKIIHKTDTVDVEDPLFCRACILVASENQRAKVLQVDAQEFGLSDITLNLFQLILQKRYAGISAIAISNELNLDPRSVFHQIRRCMESDQVVKIPLVENGKVTNLVMHKRFTNDSPLYQDYLASQMNSQIGTFPSIQELANNKATTRFVYCKFDTQCKKIDSILGSAKNFTVSKEDLMDLMVV